MEARWPHGTSVHRPAFLNPLSTPSLGSPRPGGNLRNFSGKRCPWKYVGSRNRFGILLILSSFVWMQIMSQYISLNYITIIRCVIVYSVSFCKITYDSVWLCNLYVYRISFPRYSTDSIILYVSPFEATWNLPCFFLYPSAMDISYHANLVPSQTSSRQVAPNKAESLHFQQRHHC